MNARASLFLTSLLAAACATKPATQTATSMPSPTETRATAIAPPVARIEPKVFDTHGVRRVDNYYWLRERENAEVIDYLKAENAYAEAVMAPVKPLQEQIYQEIVARIPQNDSSVPAFDDGWWYQSKFVAGKEYPAFVRRRGSETGAEEVLVDVNAIAPAQGFFDVSAVRVSPRNDLVAFAADSVGRRFYDIRFRSLTSGELLGETISRVTPSFEWSSDGRYVFYVRQDPETLRAHQVWRHEMGSDPARDVLVFEEKDATFSTYVFKTTSEEFIVIHSSQTMSDEARIVDAARPLDAPKVFEPRRRGHEYSIDHNGEHFYIRTNDGASNFRLMRMPDNASGRASWSDVVAPSDSIYLQDYALFDAFIALQERVGGLTRIRVLPVAGGTEQTVTFDDPTYVASIAENRDPSLGYVRIHYSSPTTPSSVIDYDVSAKTRTVRKRQFAGEGFDPARYVSERVNVPARDGRMLPVSLVYRRGLPRDGSAPLYVYSYGSYGISTEPSFNASVLSLVDRGFIYATPHIRGGQEMGRAWYEEGKLLRKKNTFTDFIDATDWLVKNGYGDPKRVYAAGGSAGGLLVGAVMNMRPDLYHGVVARVPFVDVITTMLDDTIPLTTSEYDEWGNPNEKEYFDYMLSYSPYDQVEAKRYPNLLVTTGLHDSQVQYWEPAKWVAKLRAVKKGDELVLLKTEMEAGHGGASGRFRRQRETAMIYAFLLMLAER
jgi:oligopeptidase B